MKKTIITLLLSALIVGYVHSQNQTNTEEEALETLRTLYRGVRFTNRAVNYHLQIHIGAVAFEILVNDHLVFRNAGRQGSGTIGLSAPINRNILRSGVQTWEVRVFPPEVNGQRLEGLPEGARIDVSLERLRFDRRGNVRHLATPIQLIETPIIEQGGRRIFADAGKPMIVYSGTFYANVPYELIGWSNGQDLSKMNQEELLEMLLDAYRTFGNHIENGELEQIARLLLRTYTETAQSLFFTREENEQLMHSFYRMYRQEAMTPLPIENYKMTFWGNNRMVTLERTDLTFLTAFAFGFVEDGRQMSVGYTLFFYMPEGSNRLEIIR